MRPVVEKELTILGIGFCMLGFGVYTLNMNETAKPIKDVYVPYREVLLEGQTWLYFMYSDLDPDPWKWPKAMSYKGMSFVWSAWDSDYSHVVYKQIDEADLARPVRKVERMRPQPGESRQSIM